MSPADILAFFFQLDVRLEPDGGDLRFDAPAGVLTPEDLVLLRTYKADVLELLRWFREPGEQSFPAASSACASCRGRQFWRSANDVRECATCHPPAAPELVVSWEAPPEEPKSKEESQ